MISDRQDDLRPRGTERAARLILSLEDCPHRCAEEAMELAGILRAEGEKAATNRIVGIIEAYRDDESAERAHPWVVTRTCDRLLAAIQGGDDAKPAPGKIDFSGNTAETSRTSGTARVTRER